MDDIDRIIKVLEQGGLAENEAEATEFTKAYEYAIENLKRIQWLITEYEHKVEVLEEDLSNYAEPWNRNTLITKIAVYERVLKDLKGDGEE